MSRTPFVPRLALLVVCAVPPACDYRIDSEPQLAVLRFDPPSWSVSVVADTAVELRNEGTASSGPITLRWHDSTNVAGQGAVYVVTPTSVAGIPSGDAIDLLLSVDASNGVAPGSYDLRLTAEFGGRAADFTIELAVPSPPPSIAIGTEADTVRQGDAAQFGAEVFDGEGNAVHSAAVRWTLTPVSAGILTDDGLLVPYEPGSARVIAAYEDAADTATVTIEQRGMSGSFVEVGTGTIGDRFTSDLWVYGPAAYTGTWSTRNGHPGNVLYVWDVSDPALPALSDSVTLDAGTVNDVKIRGDGVLGIATHEGSEDALNGITLLDLTDLLHPQIAARFTDGLESGVHNVWLDGDYVYAVADGAAGLVVVDVADPQTPRRVADFFAGSSFVHDVYVRDGLAFLAHWNAGLVVLDVGDGRVGGSPDNPVEVGRVQTAGGQTHNAWYWPDAGYVFVGEEDFGTPGVVHVVDVSDMARPTEVATISVPGSPPHNFWLDEAAGVLYVGWYANGLRAFDVSGTLLGELDRQGREIAFTHYGGTGACPSGTGSATCTWAPQLEDGLVYVSDMNTGLWVLRLDRP